MSSVWSKLAFSSKTASPDGDMEVSQAVKSLRRHTISTSRSRKSISELFGSIRRSPSSTARVPIDPAEMLTCEGRFNYPSYDPSDPDHNPPQASLNIGEVTKQGQRSPDTRKSSTVRSGLRSLSWPRSRSHSPSKKRSGLDSIASTFRAVASLFYQSGVEDKKNDSDMCENITTGRGPRSHFPKKSVRIRSSLSIIGPERNNTSPIAIPIKGCPCLPQIDPAGPLHMEDLADSTVACTARPLASDLADLPMLDLVALRADPKLCSKETVTAPERVMSHSLTSASAADCLLEGSFNDRRALPEPFHPEPAERERDVPERTISDSSTSAFTDELSKSDDTSERKSEIAQVFHIEDRGLTSATDGSLDTSSVLVASEHSMPRQEAMTTSVVQPTWKVATRAQSGSEEQSDSKERQSAILRQCMSNDYEADNEGSYIATEFGNSDDSSAYINSIADMGEDFSPSGGLPLLRTENEMANTWRLPSACSSVHTDNAYGYPARRMVSYEKLCLWDGCSVPDTEGRFEYNGIDAPQLVDPVKPTTERMRSSVTSSTLDRPALLPVASVSPLRSAAITSLTFPPQQSPPFKYGLSANELLDPRFVDHNQYSLQLQATGDICIPTEVPLPDTPRDPHVSRHDTLFTLPDQKSPNPTPQSLNLLRRNADLPIRPRKRVVPVSPMSQWNALDNPIFVLVAHKMLTTFPADFRRLLLEEGISIRLWSLLDLPAHTGPQSAPISFSILDIENFCADLRLEARKICQEGGPSPRLTIRQRMLLKKLDDGHRPALFDDSRSEREDNISEGSAPASSAWSTSEDIGYVRNSNFLRQFRQSTSEDPSSVD